MITTNHPGVPSWPSSWATGRCRAICHSYTDLCSKHPNLLLYVCTSISSVMSFVLMVLSVWHLLYQTNVSLVYLWQTGAFPPPPPFSLVAARFLKPCLHCCSIGYRIPLLLSSLPTPTRMCVVAASFVVPLAGHILYFGCVCHFDPGDEQQLPGRHSFHDSVQVHCPV